MKILMVISINGKSLVKRFSDWMFKTVTICYLQNRSAMINMDESQKQCFLRTEKR